MKLKSLFLTIEKSSGTGIFLLLTSEMLTKQCIGDMVNYISNELNNVERKIGRK